MKSARSPKGLGWVFRTLFLMTIAATLLGTVVGGLAFWFFSFDLPQIIKVEDYRPLTVTRILGAGGKDDALLGEFYKERRYLVPYDKIPDRVVKAFISAEDDTFFQHQGVNLVSIIRAAIANARAGHVVQGGSTITQQVAKSLMLTPTRNFSRKIKELILANRMERNLSKQQILYLYLNQIYLGNGAYGVQAASKVYFHKDVSELTIGEAAILAGLPQAPSNYSPNRNPKRAKERQLYVLRRMFESGHITQREMTQAAAEPLKIYSDLDPKKTLVAPYLVEHVRRYLVEKYGEKAVYEDGLTVAVPVSPELAQASRRSLQEGLRAVDKRQGYRGPLKNLGDSAQMEKFLTAQRAELVEQKLGYSMLLADGRLDAIESLSAAGLKGDYQLLTVGETYEAVVVRPDDAAKVTHVLVGAVKGELPLDQMKWARAVKNEKGEGPSYSTILPSKVFKKGDVIQVRVNSVDANKAVVALDQTPIVQGALFSLEVSTGNVLAMEGGFDFTQSEFNRAVQASRQPGSAFKPLIYGAGLERGFNPASIIVDSPVVYDDGENGTWKPENYETKFYGDTTFRQALIKSRNVPTIKIVQSITVPFLLDYLKRIGLEGRFNPDLSISLGSGSVSLVDLTKTYALFPRLGRKIEPVYVLSVRDRDGTVLEEHKPVALDLVHRARSVLAEALPVQPSDAAEPGKVQLAQLPTAEDPLQVMDPRAAYVMTHLMKEVVNYGTGYEAKRLQRPAAGKTGTTNDSIDAWFMGFTPHVVTGAWVGFDSQKPIGPAETGARAALPIWLEYMQAAVKKYPDTDFPVPNGIVFAAIDPVSGKLAAPNSSSAIREAFIDGTQPTEAAAASSGSVSSASDFLKEDSE